MLQVPEGVGTVPATAKQVQVFQELLQLANSSAATFNAFVAGILLGHDIDQYGKVQLLRDAEDGRVYLAYEKPASAPTGPALVESDKT